MRKSGVMQKIKKLTALALIFPLIFSGCVIYRPSHSGEMPFLSRAVEKNQDDVSISVVALSDTEAERFFGTKLFRKGIQPIWFQIENKSRETYIFSQRSVDSHYYSPIEAAYIAHYSALKRALGLGVFGILFFPILFAIPVEVVMVSIANHQMNSFFIKNGMENNVIRPGEKAAGFVFTPIKQGVREVHLKLYGEKGVLEFVFYVEVPGLKFDYEQKNFDTLYTPEQIVNYKNHSKFREALRELPKTTTGKKGEKAGDPVNLVIIATLEDLLVYFTSAHWDQTETLNIGSMKRMATSFIFGGANPTSPFSSLFLWGRSQDISFQKARDNVKERLHLRLWLAPMKYEGKSVWVGSVSRDIGVRFTLKTWNLMTHKIDPNIDDARDYVLVDFAENNLVEKYGFVSGLPPVTQSDPRHNLTGDSYYTDGARAVIELGNKAGEPSSFDWESPFLDDGDPVPTKSEQKAA